MCTKEIRKLPTVAKPVSSFKLREEKSKIQIKNFEIFASEKKKTGKALGIQLKLPRRSDVAAYGQGC